MKTELKDQRLKIITSCNKSTKQILSSNNERFSSKSFSSFFILHWSYTSFCVSFLKCTSPTFLEQLMFSIKALDSVLLQNFGFLSHFCLSLSNDPLMHFYLKSPVKFSALKLHVNSQKMKMLSIKAVTSFPL